MNKIDSVDFDDSLTLVDLIDFAQRSWKTVVLWSLVSLAGGTGYAFFSPSKYLATVSIQTARVAGVDVESPGVLVEKLKSPAYYSEETIDACLLSDLIDPGAELASALQPTLLKGTPLITVSYKAKSPGAALSCVNAVLLSIKKNQEIIAKPLLDAKLAELSSLEVKADAAKQLENMLFSRNGAGGFNDSKFLASSLLLTTSKDLMAQINILKLQLQEPQTKPSEAATLAFASPKPVEPKKAVVMFSCFLVGALVSIFFVLVKEQFCEKKMGII